MISFKHGSILLLAVISSSQTYAESFEQLQGHSIIVEYSETLSNIQGSPHNISLIEKIYISSGGKIFLRARYRNDFGNGGSESTTDSFDTVGDRQGIGDTRRTNYKWANSGLTRKWRSAESGVSVTESISIFDGHCKFTRERQGFNGTVEVRKSNCTMVKGNALVR